jgi:hypothetical protein
MTTRLDRGDPYRSSWYAKVIDVDHASIVLDQSCFFGPGGLLPTDTGCIAGRQVTRLRRSSTGVLTHVMAPSRRSDPAPPSAGDRVQCRIDWDERYRSMCLHTAQHLVELAAAATNDLAAAHVPKVGRNTATVDLVFRSSVCDSRAIVAWVKTVVGDDLPMAMVDASKPPHRRRWHLDGYGYRLCGALHSRSTAELRRVQLHPVELGPARLRVRLDVVGQSMLADTDGLGGYKPAGGTDGSGARQEGRRLGA